MLTKKMQKLIENYTMINREQFLEYINDYAFEFGRYFHLSPEERDKIIKSKMLTPEEFLNLYYGKQ